MLRFGLLLAAGVFVLDQASKYWVLEALQFSPPGCLETHFGCRKIEISGIFDLTMVWNYGVSFGMLKAGDGLARWALAGLSLGIAGFFVWWMRTATRSLTGWALGLVVGGALGNVVDRIRFGAVADFLDFSGLYFPWVFNVADAAITVGAALLALDFLRNGEEKQPTKAPG
ncbi:MAG: signal peptidase II [Hyphomonadaceae bacterium]|nr:MAG: signal peptidase II [Caulobacteraceae bacterium]MBT9447028.1 signal peptidase II [Hyphomonadaceae bacterium]TPW06260.1 MAG: signal peptidase II [Alphaproteobacteria bacterium]